MTRIGEMNNSRATWQNEKKPQEPKKKKGGWHNAQRERAKEERELHDPQSIGDFDGRGERAGEENKKKFEDDWLNDLDIDRGFGVCFEGPSRMGQ